jgi:hypothetical protein
MPPAPDNQVAVVGSRWTAPVLAEAFVRRGIRPRVFCTDRSIPDGLQLLTHEGNGEYFASARRIFGQPLADTLWRISQANLARAAAVLRAFGAVPAPARLAWLAREPAERRIQEETAAALADRSLFPAADLGIPLGGLTHVLTEPALELGVAAFVAAARAWLRSQGIAITPVTRLLSLAKAGTLETRLDFEREGKPQSFRASVVVVECDSLPVGPSGGTAIAFLTDKLVPVTLSSFPLPFALPMAGLFFHRGADFAIRDGAGARLGSFRNLYADRGVGQHAVADPLTRESLGRFFGGMKWPAEAIGEPILSYEALSCDGVPIAGALPEHPGAYVLAGFAARTANFIFELADRLAEDIVRGGNFSELKVFSTRRFL